MKLFKRRSPAVGRQRSSTLRSGDAPRAGSFSSYSRRSDYDFNTGRTMQREAISTQQRETRFKRSARLKHLLAIAATIIIVIALTWATPNPRVSVPAASKDKNAVLLQPATIYQAAAAQSLKQSPLNRNKLSLRSKQIATDLLDKFPEVGAVSVRSSVFSSQPNIVITPVEPALLLLTSNGLFVIDGTGTVIVNAANVAAVNKLALSTVHDTSTIPVKLHDQVLTSGNVAFVRTVVAELAAKQQTISTMTLPSGTAELDVTLVGQPYTVKFNLHSATARQQSGTFLSVQASLNQQHITPQYIDVRVPGRAYYK